MFVSLQHNPALAESEDFKATMPEEMRYVIQRLDPGLVKVQHYSKESSLSAAPCELEVSDFTDSRAPDDGCGIHRPRGPGVGNAAAEHTQLSRQPGRRSKKVVGRFVLIRRSCN
jgi:hypothetical protein